MVDSRIFSSTFSAGVTNFEVDIDDEKSLHKFIEHLFVINKGSEKDAVKLLPIKHDEKVIDTLNRVLENYRRDRDDEEGRILCAVLTVLSFYNNPESLDILEDSVLGISQYTDLEEYDYLRLIRYYTFAIAHSEGFTDQLISFYLRVLEKFPELDQPLYYLTMRHPCDHLVRKVISHKPSSRKKVNLQRLLFVVNTLQGDELAGILSREFSRPDSANTSAWGMILFCCHTIPEKAAELISVCEGIRIQNKDQEDILKEMKILDAQYKSYSRNSRLEVRSRNSELSKRQDYRIIKQLWSLFESEKFPSSEIKLLRRIKEIDEIAFLRAMTSINLLGAAINIMDEEDTWCLDVINEQRLYLNKKISSPVKILDEDFYWRTPQETAAILTVNSLSHYINDSSSLSDYFLDLRVMLTVRQNMPYIDHYKLCFPSGDSDLYLLKADEIYPLIIKTLKRELLS